LPINISKKVSVAHEMVIDFVFDTTAEINKQNDEKQFTADAFKKCR
jgi:hypothetical protein